MATFLFLLFPSHSPAQLQRLTHGEGDHGSPAWSPDGSRIAFTSNRHGNWELYVLDVAAAGIQRLTNNPAADGDPSWTSDGSKILFLRFADGLGTLRRIGADGAGEQPLFPGDSSGFRPVASPDGKRLAFDAFVPELRTHQIYAARPDGSERIRLTQTETYESAPSWSPDGRQIVFFSQRADPGAPMRSAKSELYLMNADGSMQQQLTTLGARSKYPRWSPRGRWIAFESDATGNEDIWLVSTGGGESCNVTRHPALDRNVSWSPDGRKLVFASNRAGKFDLYVLDLALSPCGDIFHEGATKTDLDRELVAMAEAERAFARTAGQKGWQHAFYDFFAEEGIGFQPDPVKYRENYRKNPPPPDPLDAVLDWEPLTGDIAESADLGWLTGPFVVLDKTEQKRPARWGFYSSVWKKQSDGTWRVLADLGIAIPSQGESLPHEQFTRIRSEQSGKPKDGAGIDGLRKAEQLLADAAGRGAAAAYAQWLSPHARLHRNGHVPFTAPGAIREHLAGQPQSGTWRTMHAEVSAAGDMGHTYGYYELTKDGAIAEKGHYMRVWKRNPQGEWRVVFDVTAPLPPVTK